MTPPPWAFGPSTVVGGACVLAGVVFLDDPEDIVRSVGYVENNPGKDGLPPQTWPFVTPFNPAAG